MKALKTLAGPDGSIGILSDLPIPSLPSPAHLLIKTATVALNPTDWKTSRHLDIQSTVGCDFAGTVFAVGDAVGKSSSGSSSGRVFKKGDRVCGAVHGCNRLRGEAGAFGEYVVCKAELVMRVPDDMGFDEAAAVGVSIVTVGQGMYQEMGLPRPDGKKKEGEKEGEKVPILIYGGSSAVGAVAVQFAKL
jgi:NADPH:quinone reductase-like Zn-dependent oxidoreductase